MPRPEALYAEMARDSISAMNKRIIAGRIYCFMQKISHFYIIGLAPLFQENVRQQIREEFVSNFEDIANKQLDIVREHSGTNVAIDEAQDLYLFGVVELLSRMEKKGDIFEQTSRDLTNQGARLLKATDPNFDSLTFRRELVAQILQKSDSLSK